MEADAIPDAIDPSAVAYEVAIELVALKDRGHTEMLRSGPSTMRQPHCEMGKWVVAHLLGSSPGPVSGLMPCPFVQCSSVGSPVR